MHDIIPLNRKDDFYFCPRGASISDENLVLIILWGDHRQNKRDTELSFLHLLLNQISLRRELHLRILLQ